MVCRCQSLFPFYSPFSLSLLESPCVCVGDACDVICMSKNPFWLENVQLDTNLQVLKVNVLQSTHATPSGVGPLL